MTLIARGMRYWCSLDRGVGGDINRLDKIVMMHKDVDDADYGGTFGYDESQG